MSQTFENHNYMLSQWQQSLVTIVSDTELGLAFLKNELRHSLAAWCDTNVINKYKDAHYHDEVIEVFKQTGTLLARTGNLLDLIDKLVCGDINQTTFIKECEKQKLL